MTTLTATTARRELFTLMKQVGQAHRVYRIQHRQGAAVLLSEADYDALLETLELLSIPGFRQRLKRSVRQMRSGQTLSLEEVMKGRG